MIDFDEQGEHIHYHYHNSHWPHFKPHSGLQDQENVASGKNSRSITYVSPSVQAPAIAQPSDFCSISITGLPYIPI
jgi:hypothetical protein